MVEKGIVLYSVGCEPAICRYKDFFMGIAFMTGGQYVPLSKAQALSKVRNNILTKGKKNMTSKFFKVIVGIKLILY